MPTRIKYLKSFTVINAFLKNITLNCGYFFRLSQAHAKLMFRNCVLVQDAIVAISLMECSNDDGSPDSINTLYTKFPTCSKEAYIKESKCYF